jgi:hypothetical protein
VILFLVIVFKDRLGVLTKEDSYLHNLSANDAYLLRLSKKVAFLILASRYFPSSIIPKTI